MRAGGERRRPYGEPCDVNERMFVWPVEFLHLRADKGMVRARLIATLLIAAVALSAGACGGDSEAEPTAATTSTTTSATEDEASTDGSAQEQINAEDQALAESVVLQLEDFPTGWREETEDNGDEEDIFEACGISLSDFTVTGRAESPDLARGEATLATSFAAVFQPEAEAEQAFALVSGDEATACFQRYLEQQGPSEEGVSVKDVSVGTLSFPSIGDESAATKIVLTLEAEPDFGGDPVEIDTYTDIIWIRQANTVAGLVFFDVLTPFPDFEKEQLASTVAERMGADVDEIPTGTGANAETGLG